MLTDLPALAASEPQQYAQGAVWRSKVRALSPTAETDRFHGSRDLNARCVPVHTLDPHGRNEALPTAQPSAPDYEVSYRPSLVFDEEIDQPADHSVMSTD